MRLKTLLAGLLIGSIAMASSGVQASPWGGAERTEKDYDPERVVYDIALDGTDGLAGVLDRVSFLNNQYEADPFDAHIVVVLHGSEIPAFAHENYEAHEEPMQRARSLTQAGPIEFRMCAAAASAHGYEAEEIHGFVELVPMADAEIIELQADGYAYMQ